MDLTQTFSRVAFYQVLLGILTFCYAEANPGMLMIAGSLVVFSRFITDSPWGKPLPGWVINITALGVVAWMFTTLALTRSNIIVTMGHFTMWLQVLILFGKKTNREYGQLLILSLLQMIGASILSVSILYGALLAFYCVLAMMTVLVFQLKSSRDGVFEANRRAAPDKKRATQPKPVVGTGYRWHLRSTAAVIACVSALTAVGVFVLIPRTKDLSLSGSDEGVLRPRQVGFSQQVRLDGPPIAQGSHEPVMNVSIDRRGQTIGSTSWLMRGAALDTYDQATRTWKRGQDAIESDRRINIENNRLQLAQLPFTSRMMHARVTLRQIGHRNLFTLLPVTRFHSDYISSVVFSQEDLQLSSGGSVMGAVVYDLYWPINHVENLRQRYRDLGQPNSVGPTVHQPITMTRFNHRRYARGWTIQPDRVAQYARTILKEYDLDRDPNAAYTPDDERITRILAEHMKNNYLYELSGPRFGQDREPIIDFLFDNPSGHCELFASALAAMTRSLGMQARVVTGFRAGEFNKIGGYYVVRQSDAHAWTEVNLGPELGWRSFDATPSQEIDRQNRNNRTWLLTTLREAYEHLEFGWIRSIVAYDVSTRHALLLNISERFKSLSTGPDSILGQAVTFVRTLPTAWRLDKANTFKAIGSAVLALIISAGLLRVIIIRRRRLAILKLTGLPPDRQRDLARQLAFFIDMNDLLAEHGYVRPQWQNPKDYAQQLAHSSQPNPFAPVLVLTDIFYRVRFGQQPMNPQIRQEVQSQLTILRQAFTDRPQNA